MYIFIVKENLIDNLCTGVTHHILDGFMSIYEDAIRVNPRNPYEQNKRFLLDIKNWPDRILQNETKRILSHFKTLRKVLKTINYINIKSLSLMGQHNIKVNDAYISQHTPSVTVFIHKIYTDSAKEFFHDEGLMNFGLSGTRSRQASVIDTVIKQILNGSVPVDDLLYNINDDTDQSLSHEYTSPILQQKTPQSQEESINNKSENNPNMQFFENDITEDEKEDEEFENDTIVIENTANNNNSFLAEDTLDSLDNTLKENLFNKKDESERLSSPVNNGFAALLQENTSLNLLDHVSDKQESKTVDIVAPTITNSLSSPTMVSLRQKGKKNKIKK